jgi:predicted AlkP superfamily phosphohydrolase/phosphomutase
LGQAGYKVVTVGVPGTYPPVGEWRPNQLLPDAADGHSGTIRAPQVDFVFTYPPELSGRVNEWAGGEYLVDVKQFRTEDKDFLLRQIYDMARQHLSSCLRCCAHRPGTSSCSWRWDGPDPPRFLEIHDPAHSKFEPGNRYEHAIRDYYRYLDRELGQVLDLTDDGRTVILVVSGSWSEENGQRDLCNEWLASRLAGGGWDLPEQPTPIDKIRINWSKARGVGRGVATMRGYS